MTGTSDLRVAEAPVSATLRMFHGVWLDLVSGYAPDGKALEDDPHGGTPGAFPYTQLVYLDFDGERLVQTNVVMQGREPASRTFRATVVDGILRFDSTGLEQPATIGVSGGVGVLVFLPERVDTDAHHRFADPDYIRYLGGDQRTRTTTLYRDGELKRILAVSGTRISTDPTRRLSTDPRGPVGPVHEPPAGRA